MTQPLTISAFVSQCPLIVFLAMGATVPAQQVMTPAPRPASFPTQMSHYSSEVLHSLGQHGVSVHSTFVNDLSKSPFSTHEDRDWFSRYSLDVAMDIDSQKAMQWKGASFHLDFKRHANMTGHMYRGVAQAYSNIDADSKMYLYEFWVLQSLAQGRLEVQLGQMDANARFATVATAADFLNSSMGYSPTIMSFPTYPRPRPGVVVSLDLPASYRIATGEFQTDDGKIAIAAGEKKWALGSEGAQGGAEFGYWKLRQPLIAQDGEQVSGTHGYYAVIEQRIWNLDNARSSESARKLTGYLQLGTGDVRENSFRSHLGCGVVFQSPFSRRPADSIGIAVSRVGLAGNSSDYRSSNGEFVSEEYYKLVLKNGVALVADAQFFANPGAGAHSAPFFVFTPRLVFSF